MNHRRITLFSVLFIALSVSVTCISLSDASEGGSEPVACIGGTGYVDLQEAIDAASDGDVVTLVSDIILTEGGGNYAFLVSGKSITIDLNGHRIEQDSPSSSYISIIATKVADTPTHLILKDSSENGTGCIYTCGIAYSMDAAVLIWNDTTNSASDGDTECSITFESGTYHAEGVSEGDGMVYTCCGTVIEDGDIKKGVWVKGGDFILDNVGTLENGSPWVFNAKGRNDGRSVMVTGGTYNSGIQDQYYVFEVDVPEHCALKDNGNGTHTIVDAICYVNVHRYNGTQLYGCESFEEALALIENEKGDTITMIDECCIDELNLGTIDIEFNLASEKGLYVLDGTSIPSNVNCISTSDVTEGCIYHRSSSKYPCLPGECTECHEPIVPAVGHEYKDGEEAITCIDRDCAVCGSKGVFTSTTDHGASVEERDMVCIDRICAICKEFTILKTGDHRFDASVKDMPCIVRVCTLCHDDIVPSAGHTDSDPSKTCIDRDCAVCGEMQFPATTGHEPSDNEADMVCKDRICHICEEFVIESTVGHTDSDPSKTCIDRDCAVCGGKDLIEGDGIHMFDVSVKDIPCIIRTCTLCDGEIAPSAGHTDSDPSKTCIDRDCTVCGTEGVFESTTGHEPSDNEADMVCKDRICHICEEFVIESTAGHMFDDMGATCVDRSCLICSETIVHTTDHDYVLDENNNSVCTLCGEMPKNEGKDHVSISYPVIGLVALLAGSLLLIGRGRI